MFQTNSRNQDIFNPNILIMTNQLVVKLGSPTGNIRCQGQGLHNPQQGFFANLTASTSHPKKQFVSCNDRDKTIQLAHGTFDRGRTRLHALSNRQSTGQCLCNVWPSMMTLMASPSRNFSKIINFSGRKMMSSLLLMATVISVLVQLSSVQRNPLHCYL